jgi:CheY-like chemotaxis protein
MSEKRMEREFTIAVVDDNPAVRRFVAKALRMCGYRVLEAGCGAEAIDAAEVEHHGNPVDLLLTDLDLSGMDGVSLSRLVRKRWPEIRVVFMSGGAMPDSLDGEPFLSKPFALRQLVTVVDDRLNSSRLSCRAAGVSP